MILELSSDFIKETVKSLIASVENVYVIYSNSYYPVVYTNKTAVLPVRENMEKAFKVDLSRLHYAAQVSPITGLDSIIYSSTNYVITTDITGYEGNSWYGIYLPIVIKNDTDDDISYDTVSIVFNAPFTESIVDLTDSTEYDFSNTAIFIQQRYDELQTFNYKDTIETPILINFTQYGLVPVINPGMPSQV